MPGEYGYAGRCTRITVWRVLTGLDAPALDTAIGDWLLDQAYAEIQASHYPDPAPAEPEKTTPLGRSGAGEPAGRLSGVAITADGKTCRGAKTPGGEQVHLLSVMTHDTRLVLNQIEVGAKTNEVPRLRGPDQGHGPAGCGLDSRCAAHRPSHRESITPQWY